MNAPDKGRSADGSSRSYGTRSVEQADSGHHGAVLTGRIIICTVSDTSPYYRNESYDP